jgi:prepilin signal peptidase PulO-like enzyme (type II secretory pathway)
LRAGVQILPKLCVPVFRSIARLPTPAPLTHSRSTRVPAVLTCTLVAFLGVVFYGAVWKAGSG